VGAHQEKIVATAPATQGRGHQQSLPDAGFDGMAVAAIGTGLTGAGWLLMLVGSRQLRRRSR
jgi:predicted cobalt transporter CbtA